MMTKKEKKRVPELRFEGFEGEWERKKLEEISRNIAYGMNAAATKFDGENQYLRITDIDEDSRTFLPSPLSSPEGEISEKFILKKGDVVFARTGASVGKSYLYNENDGKLLFAGFLIRFNIHKANPYFVFLQTFLEAYNKWVLVYSMRSGQPGLNAEEYKQLEINLPQLKEQQKIATFLTSIDSRIQQLEKKRTLLAQYKKGVMQKIFSQEVRFRDQDGKEFGEWEEKRLGEMSQIKTGKLDANAMIDNGAYRFYTCAKDYYRIDNFAFDTEALLISGNGANVGYIHYYKGKFNAYQRTYVLDEFTENIFYIKYYLQKHLSTRIEREKKDGNTPYIVLGTLAEMKMEVPCLEEQTKIAHFLSSLDRKIAVMDGQIEKTKEWKKGMLQRMFV